MIEGFEYQVVSGFLKIDSAKLRTTGTEMLARAFTPELGRMVNKLTKSLDTFPGYDNPEKKGGWDVVSHDITQVGEHFMVTFLCRR